MFNLNSKFFVYASKSTKLKYFVEKMRIWRSRNMAPREIFSEIYKKGMWGKSHDSTQPFYSGSGSHEANITSVYIESVRTLLESMVGDQDVVDLGCGDFFVGSKIRPYCNRYIACDVVPELIEYNKLKYQGLNVDFRVLDLSTDPLPSGDIVFVRQVLQHLSNDQISAFIPKLGRTYKRLILTEHLPSSIGFLPNVDKVAGSDIRLQVGSGIVLTEPPFNLAVVDSEVLCEVAEYGGVIRTISYRLK